MAGNHNVVQSLSTKVGDINNYEAKFHAKEKAASQVESFYNIATDFYEYGWGESFHFAPRYNGETFKESLIRQEHTLALAINLQPGQRCYDLGCGVGGPMRNIARLTRANITGLTCTEYQIGKGNRYIARDGLEKYAEIIIGDYHNHPWEDNSFDCGYDVEASLHSDNLERYFEELYRTLKPGGKFAGFAYVWADHTDYEGNPEHKYLVDEYMIGNGCPKWYKWADWASAMEKSGLKIVRHEDLALTGDIPWYRPLEPSYRSLAGFAATPLGMKATSALTYTLETARLIPKGSYASHCMLVRGGNAIKLAGQQKLLTPMHLYLSLIHISEPTRPY
eukprot:TRINITY_DN90_c0_g2_i2.p1 TRINITY_DN90_c0_g2~~TRINITY_DN90_c0_g2_i2.p1  ORF type:complete len:335 (-),score=88.92 TRINITY_DN90_c0_g2_i2:131-1135(-)